jgi:glycosyltransferase involved in cell wall biosynthesis
MKVSVIISTYNSPAWLEKVLWGYECQTYKNLEIVIADDGSGEPTRHLIERFSKSSNLEIIHVWHEDKGYQKCQILNKSILAAKTDYLIFTDGDCVPRNDFVEQHVKKAEKGFFLSGGAVRLPMDTSKIIQQENIISGDAFKLSWLINHGLPKKFFKNLKLTSRVTLTTLLNKLTPAKATWNGGNSSGWKRDLISVNGFDERMEYGGQDRELGERMINRGYKPKQIRYSAICVHLDHSRGYKTDESVLKNIKIRKDTRSSGKRWTPFGIVKSETPVE